MKTTTPVEPLLVDRHVAAALLGMGVDTFERRLAGGQLPKELIHPASFGGWRRFSRLQIERFAAEGTVTSWSAPAPGP